MCIPSNYSLMCYWNKRLVTIVLTIALFASVIYIHGASSRFISHGAPLFSLTGITLGISIYRLSNNWRILIPNDFTTHFLLLNASIISFWCINIQHGEVASLWSLVNNCRPSRSLLISNEGSPASTYMTRWWPQCSKSEPKTAWCTESDVF